MDFNKPIYNQQTLLQTDSHSIQESIRKKLRVLMIKNQEVMSFLLYFIRTIKKK